MPAKDAGILKGSEKLRRCVLRFFFFCAAAPSAAHAAGSSSSTSTKVSNVEMGGRADLGIRRLRSRGESCCCCCLPCRLTTHNNMVERSSKSTQSTCSAHCFMYTSWKAANAKPRMNEGGRGRGALEGGRGRGALPLRTGRQATYLVENTGHPFWVWRSRRHDTSSCVRRASPSLLFLFH